MKAFYQKKKDYQPANWQQRESIFHALTVPITFLDADRLLTWMN